jgi:hypothetical protein
MLNVKNVSWKKKTPLTHTEEENRKICVGGWRWGWLRDEDGDKR